MRYCALELRGSNFFSAELRDVGYKLFVCGILIGVNHLINRITDAHPGWLFRLHSSISMWVAMIISWKKVAPWKICAPH
jgi:hypothetical protein